MADSQPLLVPPKITRPTRGAKLWLAVAGGMLLCALAVLYFFDPTQHAFYPRCEFYQVTHLLCPGCGSLRAMHHLVHGEFIAALRCNPMLIAGIPAVIAFLWFRRVEVFNRALSPRLAWVVLVTVLAFGIIRNLPWVGAAWMSP